MVKRSEVWLAALDPTIGSEIKKTRPCVVISPPELNEHLRTAIVAPLTSQGRAAPFRIPITFQRKKGLILLDQIRALDKTRLVRKLGTAQPDTLSATLTTLQALFAR